MRLTRIGLGGVGRQGRRRVSSTSSLAATLALVVPAAFVPPASGAPAETTVSFTEIVALYASDAAEEDFLGNPVAIDGDTVLVGARSDDDAGPYSGAAYVFQRDADGSWREVVKLTQPDGESSDRFGSGVALSGDTALVGARGVNVQGICAGAAYIFQRDAGGADRWGLVAVLTAEDGEQGDGFGVAAALDGDTAVIGAFGEDDRGPGAGAAYVFERHAGGDDAWGQVAKLTAHDGGAQDSFGDSVAVDGDTIVVGASFHDALDEDSGSAYVFHRDATAPGGGWGQVAHLFPPDGDGGDRFGVSLAISGSAVVVGAFQDDDFATDSGSVYVFRLDPGFPSGWYPVAKLHANDWGTGVFFGLDVAVDGDTVVAGAPRDDDQTMSSGAAYVFRRDAGEPKGWRQLAKLTAVDGDERLELGQSVAISGDLLAIGAPLNDAAAESAGAVHVFEEVLIDPFLTVPEGCDGVFTFTVTGLTQRGRTGIRGARAEGTHTLDRGPCKGTVLSLEDPVRLGDSARADEEGTVSRTGEVPPVACGGYYQALDLTSCALTDVERIPPAEERD